MADTFRRLRQALDAVQTSWNTWVLGYGASRQRQNCAPSEPVSVLHVHGDNDPTVRFDGDGSGEMAYPGALASLANWASYDGCSGQLVADSGAGAKLDLDSTIAGAETEVSRYAGCPAGIDLELWRIVGGGHLPLFVTPTIFAELTFDWLLAHPKR